MFASTTACCLLICGFRSRRSTTLLIHLPQVDVRRARLCSVSDYIRRNLWRYQSRTKDETCGLLPSHHSHRVSPQPTPSGYRCGRSDPFKATDSLLCQRRTTLDRHVNFQCETLVCSTLLSSLWKVNPPFPTLLPRQCFGETRDPTLLPGDRRITNRVHTLTLAPSAGYILAAHC